MGKDSVGGKVPPGEGLKRTVAFWTRSLGIYAGYKVCQLQALALAAAGQSRDAIEAHWRRHHTRAAQDMYQLCIDLRGFYLKVCTTGLWGCEG